MFATIPDFLAHVSSKYKTRRALYIRRFLRSDIFTYEDIENLSLKIASYLLENGVEEKQTALIWAPNMPEWILAFLGCLTAGIVAIPVGVHSTDEVVEKYIEQTEPKVLFLSKFYPIDFKKNAHTKIRRIYLEDLVALVEHKDIKILPAVHSSELAEIVFTSGTTGEPKGVMISHHNILYELAELLKILPEEKEYRTLSVLPLSHVLEQVDVFASLSRGATMYFLPRVNLVTIKKALKKHQVTHLAVVPQILRLFLDNIELELEKEKKEKLFESLRKISTNLPIPIRRILFKELHDEFGGHLSYFGVGSAPLDVKLASTFENMGFKVVEGYGASETTGGVTINRPETRKLGSVGQKLPGMEIKISSAGEIHIKGDNVTSGYFLNKEKTKESFTSDGFFKSGDHGYFDQNGYLYINGRDKFKIVTAAGDKVFPEDVERKLNTHPDIWDSCVLGVKRGDGEIVFAAIILKKTAKTKAEEIILAVNKNLEPNQQILDFKIWPEPDFPRLHTLKVDRNKVQDYIENRSGAQYNPPPLVKSKDSLIKIVAEVCKSSENKISEDTKLANLGLDSLRRVELVSLVEEEFGTEIDEVKIGNDTRVEDLRKLIKHSSKTKYAYDLDKIAAHLRHPFHKWLKIILQDYLVFPLFRIFAKVYLTSSPDWSTLPQPFVIIGNHPAAVDPLCLLSILPKSIRKNLIILTDEIGWHRKIAGFIKDSSITGPLVSAFPLNKRGGPLKENLDAIIDFLDDGYNLIILPEGTWTPRGEKLGPLKTGLWELLNNTGIYLIPFYDSGNFSEAFVQDETWKAYIPKKKLQATICFGKPFQLTNTTKEAGMNLIKEKILELVS